MPKTTINVTTPMSMFATAITRAAESVGPYKDRPQDAVVDLTNAILGDDRDPTVKEARGRFAAFLTMLSGSEEGLTPLIQDGLLPKRTLDMNTGTVLVNDKPFISERLASFLDTREDVEQRELPLEAGFLDPEKDTANADPANDPVANLLRKVFGDSATIFTIGDDGKLKPV